MSAPQTLQTFDGPLDALLQLIENEELDITSVSLAKVTDQYLSHVEALERQNLPEISDWLVIAARLILLKSRALLAVEVEDDEADDLTKQLMEYKRMKELATALGEGLTDAPYLAGGQPQKVAYTGEPVFDGVSVDALSEAFTKLIEDLPAPRPLREESLESQVTIEECIGSVKGRLASGRTAFAALFDGLKSRVAMIVTFLAVLELFKQRQLAVASADGGLMVELRG